MKPTLLQAFLVKAIKARRPILVKGAPGIGKTDIVKAAALQSKADLIITHPVVDDPTDYKGLPYVVEGHADFMPFGNLRRLRDAKRLTICFMDDLGQAVPTVQAAAMQLILGREINGIPISKHVMFIAATNRKQDKAGVAGVLEPVKSRFASIIELEVSDDDWVKWAFENNMPTELIGFIRYRPGLLHDFKATADITNTPSPRTVANVGYLMNMGCPAGTEYDAYMGAAGKGFASELIAYLEVCDELPDLKVCLDNPKTVKVPEKPATRFAMCVGLAARVTETKMKNFVILMDRFPPDFAVMAIKTAATKTPSLKNTKEFIKWVAVNNDVLI